MLLLTELPGSAEMFDQLELSLDVTCLFPTRQTSIILPKWRGFFAPTLSTYQFLWAYLKKKKSHTCNQAFLDPLIN